MKPIFLNDDEKKKIVAEFEQKLAKMKMFDGSFECKYSYSYEKGKMQKAKLWYAPEAWAKMTALVDMFPAEIGWQGSVERLSDNEWMVTDIFVYPQTVTAAHVDTDEQEFGKWLVDMAEEHCTEEATINFQGHSHVNMAVSPSVTDLEDQRTRMENMKRGYYIFTIQNKKRESKTWIYDYDNNVAYMPEDIEVDVMVYAHETLYDFIDEAKGMVTEHKYTPTKGTVVPAAPPKKSDKKEDAKGFYGDYYPYLAGNGYGYGYSYYEE